MANGEKPCFGQVRKNIITIEEDSDGKVNVVYYGDEWGHHRNAFWYVGPDRTSVFRDNITKPLGVILRRDYNPKKFVKEGEVEMLVDAKLNLEKAQELVKICARRYAVGILKPQFKAKIEDRTLNNWDEGVIDST
jgi:hypothetical protein